MATNTVKLSEQMIGQEASTDIGVPTPDTNTQSENGAAAPIESINSESKPVSEMLLQEVCDFLSDCKHRYKFNNNWDNTLNAFGILTSVAIVGSGVFNDGPLSAMLGGFVAAIVTAQRAFPFSQRSVFYRNLIGQTQNLLSECKFGIIDQRKAIQSLNSLRLDFAQQLPRGTSFEPDQ